MSQIGKNIRKIRGVKGLSQTAFAELFGLNRANVGSYEEGRADPKIEVILRMAKYFGVNLNALLEEELTVNQIAGFLEGGKELEEAVPESKSVGVEIVRSHSYHKYLEAIDAKEEVDLEHFSVSNLSAIQMRAFEVNGNMMRIGGKGLNHGDVVFASFVPEKFWAKISGGMIYILVCVDGIHIGRAYSKEDNVLLKLDNPAFGELERSFEEIHEIWKAESFFSSCLPLPPESI